MKLVETLYTILEPFLLMGLLGVAAWGVSELRKHGYKATYAAALVRAMGAGVLAAQDKGVDPFTAQGRMIVAMEGAKYIESTIPDTADALGLIPADHMQRVTAQLGSVAAQAEAVAQASLNLNPNALLSALKDGMTAAAPAAATVPAA